MRDNEWRTADYPLVLGHEGVCRVTHIGSSVRSHQPGDIVVLGWIRDCCTACRACLCGRENICAKGSVGMFDGPSAGSSHRYNEHGGCFSRIQRIEARFAIKVPDGIPWELAAPLACGGATVWEPIRNHGFIGARIGIVGLGGLGTSAVRLARVAGCVPVAISRSDAKRAMALAAGAQDLWVESENREEWKESLDVIIDTRPVNGPLAPLLSWIRKGGVVVRVGLPPADDIAVVTDWHSLVFDQKTVAGSDVCGSAGMAEMYSAIASNLRLMKDGEELKVEKLPMSEVNTAMDRLLAGEHKSYRFVLEW